MTERNFSIKALPSRFLGIFARRSGLTVTIILILQCGLYYGAARQEMIPHHEPLAGIPNTFPGWSLYSQGVIEQDVQAVLRADDTLTRTYIRRDGAAANLFIAYFKSQRSGVAPHSPKNCLPGAGWEPLESKRVSIHVPGRDAPIKINQYVVARGDNRSVVLYWYESHNRVIASEYFAKIYLVVDALRYNRSDTSLVRVTVPVIENNVKGATETALDFVRASFEAIQPFSPA